jgi:predicted nucleic acid-binding protein
MTSKILTYVDASVLIYGAVKPTTDTFHRRLKALQVLGDPSRDEYLKLEVMPIARYFMKGKEIKFYEAFFAGVSQWISLEGLIDIAYKKACQYGLGALDALHIAAAESVGAEVVSAERPTKPIYRAYTKISSIY